MTFALVVITGMSISSVVSSVVVMSVRNKEKAARDAKEDARDAKKRARQERVEARERASKEANETARAEVVEAERIEKESSEWATMLNNFMVAKTLGKGDLTELVNNGGVGVPRELAPRVVKKLKKRNSKLQYCKGKYITDKEEKSYIELSNEDDVLSFIDPLGFKMRIEHQIPIEEKMWDGFFKWDGKGSAFEITQCYEKKTKGMPDFFDSNNCERNKHLEYLENCGGQEDIYGCPCKASLRRAIEEHQKNLK